MKKTYVSLLIAAIIILVSASFLVSQTAFDLKTNAELDFTHLVSDSKLVGENSISVFDTTIISKGITYTGKTKDRLVTYDDEPENFVVSTFINEREYAMSKGDVIKIDDILSLELKDVSVIRSRKTNTITDFRLDYKIIVNRNIFTSKYKDNSIVLSNIYKSVNGGLIVTTVDNLGTTQVYELDKFLYKGDTFFTIDTTNILEIKARPFIIINDVKIDANSGIMLDIKRLEDNKELVTLQEENKATKIFWIMLAIIVIVVTVVYIGRKLYLYVY